MVTGSHNPPEYNGFKISVGKETIHGNDIQELKEIMQNEAKGKAEEGAVKTYNIIEAYKGYMLNEFSYLNDSKFKRLKVVVDAGNGTAGMIAPEILTRIGYEVKTDPECECLKLRFSW